jgi:hypothetical protein
MNLDEYSQDLLDAQRRIAVALEEITALTQQLVEYIVMRPSEDDDAGCEW